MLKWWRWFLGIQFYLSIILLRIKYLWVQQTKIQSMSTPNQELWVINFKSYLFYFNILGLRVKTILLLILQLILWNYPIHPNRMILVRLQIPVVLFIQLNSEVVLKMQTHHPSYPLTWSRRFFQVWTYGPPPTTPNLPSMYFAKWNSIKNFILGITEF